MWLYRLYEAEEIVDDEEETTDDGGAGVVVANLQKLAKQGSKKAKDALKKMGKDAKSEENELKSVIGMWNTSDKSGNKMKTSYENSKDGLVVTVEVSGGAKKGKTKGASTYTRTFPNAKVAASLLSCGKLESQIAKGRTVGQSVSSLGFKRQ